MSHFNNKYLIILTVLFSLVFFNCCVNEQTQHNKYQIIDEAVTNSSNTHYFDAENYPNKRVSLPIGVFDSGTGGLSVLNSVLELDEFNNSTHEAGSDGIADFISERFIYLADEANMPYGKYNAEGKADFLRELVIKDVLFMLGDRYYLSPGDTKPQRDKDAVKSIVIACNTATAYGLETVRNAIDSWGVRIKIAGIIEAGARSAVEVLEKRKHGRSAIGVFATEGTCASGGYPTSVLRLVSDIQPEKQVSVVQQAGIGLAGAIDKDINYLDPLATEVRSEDEYYGPRIGHPDYPIDLSLWKEYNFEEGSGLLIEKDSGGNITNVQLNSVINYIRYMVTHLLITAQEECPEDQLDAVILGCTHYPYFVNEIHDHFMYLRQLNKEFSQIIPANIVLINPAKSLAVELYETLKKANMFADNQNTNSSFYISVPNPLLQTNIIDEKGEFPYSWKYGREINTSLQYVKIVPFSDEWIDAGIKARLQNDLPSTYNVIYQ